MQSEEIQRKLQISLPYTPHEKQKLFHESPSKFRAFVGGLGSGKTFAGCVEAVLFAIRNPGSLGIIAAPTYPMLRDATIRTFFERACPKELVVEYHRGENRVELMNKSEILFRSCDDPEKLRGPNLAFVYVDEAALVSSMSWKILIGRLRQPDMQNRAWVTSTPKGFNWIYDEFVKKVREEYDIVYCPTGSNPYLPPEYIKSLEEAYTGVFLKQELGGQFVGLEGLVYNNFSRDENLIRIIPFEFKEVIAGIDWGWSNPTAIVVVGKDNDDRYYVVDEFYQRRVQIEDVITVAKQLKDKYDIRTFYADPSEPQFIQKFRGEGLSTLEANNEIIPGIEMVAAKISKKGDGRPGLFVHERCVNTLMEFENYAYMDVKEGKPQIEKPLKIHDHAMDALRYALMGEKTGARIGVLSPLDEFWEKDSDPYGYK